MGLKDDAKVFLPLILIVVSIGLVQENLRTVFPIIDGGAGLIVGLLGLTAGIYFGFVRKAIG